MGSIRSNRRSPLGRVCRAMLLLRKGRRMSFGGVERTWLKEAQGLRRTRRPLAAKNKEEGES